MKNVVVLLAFDSSSVKLVLIPAKGHASAE